MVIEKQKIKCPKCGEEISIDDVLTHQIEDKIKKDFETTQKAKELELTKKSEELTRQASQIAESKKEIDSLVATKLADQLNSERIKLYKDTKAEIEKEQAAKTALLQEQLKQKEEKLDQATQKEIELLKEKMRLEDEKKAFELEKLRQLEEAKIAIAEEASKKAAEEQHYIIAQLQKQVSDAVKAKDELARKLEQGSQQTQGEVLELELEELLKGNFLHDEIAPVPKGVSGADIIQKVINRSGHLCGQIVWESKKTKAWSDGWIQKLKEDQRTIKADLAVIVSATLPDDVKGFALRDGVWICDTKMSIALATALRINLESVAREKIMSVGKNEKMEILYSYLTGVEFKQRVEAIADAFSVMDEGLRKERNAYEKIWAEREKQIQKAMKNLAGMFGDFNGLVTLPQIKRLELEEDQNV
jgi:hypothetical protein